jgi:hypothetical protein
MGAPFYCTKLISVILFDDVILLELTYYHFFLTTYQSFIIQSVIFNFCIYSFSIPPLRRRHSPHHTSEILLHLRWQFPLASSWPWSPRQDY